MKPVVTRRDFLKASAWGGAGLITVPGILARSAWGQGPAHERIQIAQIGCGRMGRGDMEEVLDQGLARVVAVCDLDSKRMDSARQAAIKFYKGKGESNVAVKAYRDFREVLANPDIDAVVVSTPDHWHGLVAVQAALAGKDLYVQKPLTYGIAEAIALRTAVRAKKVILQTGSQQRSERPFPAFRIASEAVRNGRIGKVHTIRVGVGMDKPKGEAPAPMPIPPNLDFDRWLGPAQEQPYMEGRVHPQDKLGRPGWITTEDFGLGMITNWGAHHVDIAQWAMGMELSGPTSIEAKASFMTNDVWTVHRDYHVEMLYSNGVRVILDNQFENGCHFEGSDGWVFCSRGEVQVTSSDGNAGDKADKKKAALRASDPNVLAQLGPDAKRWPPSPNHCLNWLEAIRARHDPIAPVDQSARSLETCAGAWIAMKLGRKLNWDPAKEAFVGDTEANALLARKPRRAEFDIRAIMKKAGLA